MWWSGSQSAHSTRIRPTMDRILCCSRHDCMMQFVASLERLERKEKSTTRWLISTNTSASTSGCWTISCRAFDTAVVDETSSIEGNSWLVGLIGIVVKVLVVVDAAEFVISGMIMISSRVTKSWLGNRESPTLDLVLVVIGAAAVVLPVPTVKALVVGAIISQAPPKRKRKWYHSITPRLSLHWNMVWPVLCLKILVFYFLEATEARFVNEKICNLPSCLVQQRCCIHVNSELTVMWRHRHKGDWVLRNGVFSSLVYSPTLRFFVRSRNRIIVHKRNEAFNRRTWYKYSLGETWRIKGNYVHFLPKKCIAVLRLK